LTETLSFKTLLTKEVL